MNRQESQKMRSIWSQFLKRRYYEKRRKCDFRWRGRWDFHKTYNNVVSCKQFDTHEPEDSDR